ncbi:MAG: hypothetical protein Ct9H300mP23_01590 [Nitrospinota bacterium]|nr:MAG: hypothetical protein Ct9H300mP23_01590 [Nitrospinota bacterium]
MARKALIAKQKRKPKFAVRGYSRCKSVDGQEPFLESLVYAAFVFARGRCVEKFLVLLRPVGNEIELIIFGVPL